MSAFLVFQSIRRQELKEDGTLDKWMKEVTDDQEKTGDKLIVTLKKKDKIPWDSLRSKVCLPFRRGGGG